MLNNWRFFRCIDLFQSLRALQSRMSYYAVRAGRNPGVYHTWKECKAEVDQFPKARYKKFSTEAEAAAFVRGSDSYSFQGQPQNSTAVGRGGSGGGRGSKVDTDLKKAEKEIEVLKKKLIIKEKEKELLEQQKELTHLKQDVTGGKQTNKSPSSKASSAHGAKPYSRGKVASSAAWKQNKTTQLIDPVPAHTFHTSSSAQGAGSKSAVVYTDGACRNNGRGEARAGIGVFWGPDHPLNTSKRLSGRQTNNRAEIYAVVTAVEQAKRKGLKEITVKTDSQFLINAMTMWLPGWKRKDWKISDGTPVKNKDDFQALEKASAGIQVNYVHVPGHQGDPGNESADRLAVAGTAMPSCD